MASKEKEDSDSDSDEEITTATDTTTTSSTASKDSKRNKNTPLNMLSELSPQVLRVATVLLEFFYTREGEFSLNRSTLMHFCRQQCVLTAMEINRRIKKRKLRNTDIYEMSENILVLHDNVLKKSMEAAADMGALINKILVIVAELAGSLEAYMEVPPTNWVAVGTNVLAKTQSYQPTPPNFTDYIPSVKHFKSLKVLGTGGFGVVYRATYLSVNLPIVMKIISFDRVAKGSQAAADKVLSTMVHSAFVIKYYSCFATKEAYITLMEYFDCMDLLSAISKIRHFSSSQLQLIVTQCMIALEHLHSKGFIHRDIKVSNILIAPSGLIKIIDFDTAKICIGHFARVLLKSFFRRTRFEFFEPEAAGTLPYMAPELFLRKPFGRASDWWSFGITIHKMALGRVPFQGSNKAEVSDRVTKRKLAFKKSDSSKSSFTPECRKMICAFLTKNPSKRLGSKNYRDMFSHVFLKDIDFKKVATSVTFSDFAELGESVLTSTLSKNDQETDYLPKVAKKFLKLDELTDADKTEASRIMCFVSPKFKDIMDAVAKSDSPTTLLESFKDDEDSLPRLGFDEYAFEQSMSMTTQTQAGADQAKKNKQDTVNIFIVRKKSFGRFWSFGFELQPAKAEDGTIKYLVDSIKKDSPAESAHLYVGDIVLSINGTAISNMPEKLQESILSNASDRVVLQVVALNPFRLLNQRKDFSSLLKSCSKMNVEVTREKRGWLGSDVYFGFEIIESRTWSEESNAFAKFFIVTKVHPDIKLVQGTLYIGDIILTLGDTDIQDYTLPRLQALMALPENSVLKFQIAPFSALRTHSELKEPK